MKKTAWPAAAAAVVTLGITLAGCGGIATAGAGGGATATAAAGGGRTAAAGAGRPAPSTAPNWYSVCSRVINQTATSNTWQSTDGNGNKATITPCGYWVTQAGTVAGYVTVWAVFAEQDDQPASFSPGSAFSGLYIGSANCSPPGNFSGCTPVGSNGVGQVFQSGAFASGMENPLYAGPFQMYAAASEIPYNDATSPLTLVYSSCANGSCGPGASAGVTENYAFGAGRQAIPTG